MCAYMSVCVNAWLNTLYFCVCVRVCVRARMCILHIQSFIPASCVAE